VNYIYYNIILLCRNRTGLLGKWFDVRVSNAALQVTA